MSKRISLNYGAYTARSLIANAQRCVNLFPEVNQEDAPVRVTQYETPGLTVKVRPTTGPVRCLYRATTGATFACIGNAIYFFNFGFVPVLCGTINSSGNYPVSMSDNGAYLIIVDNTPGGGWWLRLGTMVITKIDDEAFYGATRVQYLDTFFVFNRPNTNQFYLSPPMWNGQDPMDPLDIAAKTGGPDQILSISVRHRELWLIGQVTTEVWYNAGGADFPFERLPGVFVQYGTVARFSVTETDVTCFFLARDNVGQGIVMQGKDYNGLRISTHAVEDAIRSYPIINDAIGFCYQLNGHTFYILTFPNADRTWAYDLATGMWHELSSTDENGVEHRHRAQCAVVGYDHTVICGDHSNGKVYAYDVDNGTDDGMPIIRRRGFPHMQKDGRLMSHIKFQLDMEVGNFGGSPPSQDIMLRWSDTRGYSWGDAIPLPLGTTGEYYQSLQAQQLGIARDRVYEVFWSAPRTTLQGAWIEAEVAEK